MRQLFYAVTWPRARSIGLLIKKLQLSKQGWNPSLNFLAILCVTRLLRLYFHALFIAAHNVTTLLNWQSFCYQLYKKNCMVFLINLLWNHALWFEIGLPAFLGMSAVWIFCFGGVCGWRTPAVLDMSLQNLLQFWTCLWFENSVPVLNMSMLLGRLFLQICRDGFTVSLYGALRRKFCIPPRKLKILGCPTRILTELLRLALQIWRELQRNLNLPNLTGWQEHGAWTRYKQIHSDTRRYVWWMEWQLRWSLLRIQEQRSNTSTRPFIE